MSRLTRDGTAKPVSRGQSLRGERGQGDVHFPCSADREQDYCQPYLLTLLIHTTLSCYMMCDYTYIHNTYISVKCQFHPWSQRGTQVSGLRHGGKPLLRPTGIQIATKPLPGPTNREHRKLIGVKTMSLGTNHIIYVMNR